MIQVAVFIHRVYILPNETSYTERLKFKYLIQIFVYVSGMLHNASH